MEFSAHDPSVRSKLDEVRWDGETLPRALWLPYLALLGDAVPVTTLVEWESSGSKVRMAVHALLEESVVTVHASGEAAWARVRHETDVRPEELSASLIHLRQGPLRVEVHSAETITDRQTSTHYYQPLLELHVGEGRSASFPALGSNSRCFPDPSEFQSLLIKTVQANSVSRG